jgi:hypothetical protein
VSVPPIVPARRPLRWLLRPVLVALAGLAFLSPGTAAHADPTPAQIEAQITDASTNLEQVVEQFNKVTEELAATQGRGGPAGPRSWSRSRPSSRQRPSA